MEENREHHFLYYIFKMDKAEKKMPKLRFEKMMKIIKKSSHVVEKKEF